MRVMRLLFPGSLFGAVLAGLGFLGATPPQSGGLPSLRRVNLHPPSDQLPERPLERLGVSTTGLVAFRSPKHPDGRQVVLLDSTGRVLSRIAPTGQGPGEVTSPTWFGFLGDTALIVFDGANLRISQFAPGGRFLRSRQGSPAGVPRAVGGDSIDFVLADPLRRQVRRLSLRGGEGRTVVSGNEREVEDAFPIDRSGQLGPGAMRPHAAYASQGDRIAMGNGQTYRIVLLDRRGRATGIIDRKLPDRYPTETQVSRYVEELKAQHFSPGRLERFTAQYRTRAIPWFDHIKGLDFDGRGRLWVIGQQGDSAYADLYQGTRLLGRLGIGCRGFNGSFDVTGDWVALLCAPSEANSPAGSELQLYRISGG